jgi:hypothetical protein
MKSDRKFKNKSTVQKREKKLCAGNAFFKTLYGPFGISDQGKIEYFFRELWHHTL